MLAAFVESRDELRGRVKTYCFDLHRRFFRPESFDLVIGAAILHHLLDPRAALVNVAASIKPGGKIILVEPLEAGSLVLTAMYAGVLRIQGELGQGDGDLARLMKALRLDIQCRLGPPAAKPWTATLDDKWVFDEPYLVELARQLGIVESRHPSGTGRLDAPLRGGISQCSRRKRKRGIGIPAPVLECVREFDRGIDSTLKQRLCPTGIIVFTK